MFRKKTMKAAAMFLALALVTFCVQAAGVPIVVELYVSPSGQDAWSGNLPEPNSNQTDGPTSLTGVKQRVRQLVRQRFQGEIRILLRAGRYYLERPLEFTIQDSGSAECRITYASSPGEWAELIGGVKLRGWQPYKGRIVKARLPDGVTPRQVFENTRPMILARMPRERWFRIERPVEGNSRNGFVFKADDLRPFQGDFSEGWVRLWPWDWYTVDVPILAQQPGRHEILVDRRRTGGPDFHQDKPGYPATRYALMNILELLDVPGEAFISLKERAVYCWPAAGRADDQEIVVSAARNVIRVAGTPQQPVRNLHFRDLHLTVANEDVVYMTGTEGCSVRGCRIDHAEECGVLLHEHATRDVIYGNLIRENTLHGVQLGAHGFFGMRPKDGGKEILFSQPYWNHHNTVENNLIERCGWPVGHGVGVFVCQSGENEIVHNEIRDLPRHGVFVQGMGCRADQLAITPEDRWLRVHSRGNHIAWNYIHDTVLNSDDAGPIDLFGAGRDNVIENNLIYDFGAPELHGGGGNGIYLEMDSDYTTIRKNVVSGSRLGLCILAKGQRNRIENNVLVADAGTRYVMGFHLLAGAITPTLAKADIPEEFTLRHNVIVVPGENTNFVAVTCQINWNEHRFADFDQNLYWLPSRDANTLRWTELRWGDERKHRRPTDQEISHVEGLWRSGSKQFDRHSLFADPLFADSKCRDYRLQPQSPALRLGCESIEVNRIGLKADFPAGLRNQAGR
jgi:parallel beta-helix repeat protein